MFDLVFFRLLVISGTHFNLVGSQKDSYNVIQRLTIQGRETKTTMI